MAFKHQIKPELGVELVNSRPYWLPELEREEVRKQVEEFRDRGIVTESHSRCNIPLLAVPKKSDTTSEKQWRLVIDFRKLNEKTVGNAYPLPVSQKC
jgi:hypothetical protein